MRLSLSILLIYLIVLSVGCREEKTDSWESVEEFNASFDQFSLPISDNYQSPAQILGEVNEVTEASGLAKSYSNAHGIWSHNDAGNSSLLFLLNDTTGSILAGFRIPGLTNIDWEDIETGTGPKAGVHYIYVADIGDNNLNRPFIFIYRIPEPYYVSAYHEKIIDVNIDFDRLILKYPDGSHNAETLLLDPISLDLFVVTKYGAQSNIYGAKYPQKDTTEMIKLGSFPFREATGGDISENGETIAIKTYEKIYSWDRTANQTVWEALSAEPKFLPYNPIEAKGEAICFANGGYYTLSEKYQNIIPTLNFYPSR